MLVMGPPFDHPERLLTEEQIERSIRVLGTVPFEEIGTALAASDALIMPLSNCLYNWGRWPNKIGDYLAAGRPVVCTAVGDAPALVRRHGVGWVGEASEEGLAGAMAQAAEEKSRWREMSRAARRVAETDLSWERLTRDLAGAVLDRTGIQLMRQ
jgi:glycosyltransferase involved in cell wall biosynthesis